jgi:hypothetical protein
MFGPAISSYRPWASKALRRYAPVVAIAAVLAGVAALGGSWGTANGQTIPPGNIFVPGVLPAGSPIITSTGQQGGSIPTGNSNVGLTLSPNGVGGSANAQYQPVLTSSLPSLPEGFQAGGTSFQLTISGSQGGTPTGLSAPMVVSYHPTAEELAAAGGDLARVVLVFWDTQASPAQWVAVAGSPNADGTVTYTIPHLTLFTVAIIPVARGAVDSDLANGHFYGQANGFAGALGTGFAVTDDAQASFWSEFQRLGGASRVGYPVTGRFMHGGFLTQAFQKMALQWRPESKTAVPVNILDDLHQKGADGFLDVFKQVPAPASTIADAGLSWNEVVARHVSMLDDYPAMKDFYLSDPNWLETYGLPVSVSAYGPMVTARLQRGMLQLWTVDMPWAKAGTVVVGNGGDLAKEAGLWPIEAGVPTKP